jgi:hypothetical protein
MLRPDKHMNLDVSIVNITAFLLSQFRRREKVGYEELLESVRNGLNEDAAEIYPYALNFLFLLGKIEYESNSDCFILNEIK